MHHQPPGHHFFKSGPASKRPRRRSHIIRIDKTTRRSPHIGSKNACRAGRPPPSSGPLSRSAVRHSQLIVNSWSTVRSTLPLLHRNTASITSSSSVGNIVLKSAIASLKSSPTVGGRRAAVSADSATTSTASISNAEGSTYKLFVLHFIHT